MRSKRGGGNGSALCCWCGDLLQNKCRCLARLAGIVNGHRHRPPIHITPPPPFPSIYFQYQSLQQTVASRCTAMGLASRRVGAAVQCAAAATTAVARSPSPTASWATPAAPGTGAPWKRSALTTPPLGMSVMSVVVSVFRAHVCALTFQ